MIMKNESKLDKANSKRKKIRLLMQEAITDYLKNNKDITAYDISKSVENSPSGIKRYLEMLELDNKVLSHRVIKNNRLRIEYNWNKDHEE